MYGSDCDNLSSFACPTARKNKPRGAKRKNSNNQSVKGQFDIDMQTSDCKSLDTGLNFQEDKQDDSSNLRCRGIRESKQNQRPETKRNDERLEETRENDAQLTRALEEANKKKAEAEAEIARLNKALEEVDNKNTEAEEEIAHLNKALEEVDKKNTEAEEEIAQLNKALEEVDKKNTEAEEEIAQLNKALEEVDNKNTEAEEEIAHLNKALEEVDKKNTEAEEEIAQLKRASEKNLRYFTLLASVLVVVPLCIGLHLAFKGHEINHHELRLMLVGKTGAGKSASGNTILGEEAFRVEASPASVTGSCKRKNKFLDGRNITIIDTPGVMDTWLISDQTSHNAHECIFMSSPDPHVFLLVISLGRFTVEERNAVKWIQENFGEEALKFTMILFTGGDLLEGKPVEKFISNSYDLQVLVNTCEGRYHVFNNYEQSNRTQVKELFEKINVILHKNMGYFYTKDVHQKIQQQLANEVKAEAQSRLREIRRDEELKRKRMEEEMKVEERKKINKMAIKLRDEQYENRNLKAELENAYSTSWWFKILTGILILTLIIVVCIKQ